MKYNELVVGEMYWCAWGYRFARFVRIEKHTYEGEVYRKAVFRDFYGCFMECDIRNVERWVMSYERVKDIVAPIV